MPEMVAPFIDAAEGGYTWVSLMGQVSCLLDRSLPNHRAMLLRRAYSMDHYNFDPSRRPSASPSESHAPGPVIARHHTAAPRDTATAARLHLHEPLVAVAAVPRPDPRTVRVRVPFLGRARAPGRGRVRRPDGAGRSGRRDGLPVPERPDTQADRDGDHARRAGADRRRDDLEPADHGDRRRVRDFRQPHEPGGASG